MTADQETPPTAAIEDADSPLEAVETARQLLCQAAGLCVEIGRNVLKIAINGEGPAAVKASAKHLS
jgi:hypothetical protein